MLPVAFESDTEGALSTDIPGLVLPPQVLRGWKFYLLTDTRCWTSLVTLAGVEYLIKVDTFYVTGLTKV